MPSLDLVALWEAHCRYEFDTRDVDATMATMVSEPYVNHMPTMTGGVGHDQLKRFYKYHFIAFVISFPKQRATGFPVGYGFATKHIFFGLFGVCQCIPYCIGSGIDKDGVFYY